MALRAIDPDYAPSSHNGIRFSNFGSKINGVKEAILLVLKDTDWPEHATNDVQALIQTMENLSVLNTLPKEENEIPDQPKIEIERLLRTLESVYTRLKHESENYSTRKKGFRKRVKSLFSRNNPSEITLVLRRCRNDVEHSSTALSELLRNLDIGEDSRSSPVFKAKAGDDAEILGGSHVALGAPSSDLDSGLGFGTAPVQSNNGPHRLAPQVHKMNSSRDDKQQGSSTREEWLHGANNAFRLAGRLSGALPVVGGYVAAVANVGLTVVEMVQTMDGNDETAKRLGNHVLRLSKVLERVSEQPQGLEKTQTMKGMDELQRELQSVQDEIVKLKTQRGIRRFWSSDENAGSLKKLQDQVQTSLEEIQLLANLNVSILITELYNGSVETEQRRLLDRLADGQYGARGNLIESVTCLPGTRVEILERIDDWIRGAGNSERVLWVRGMAGKGKSTIASTVALNWERRAACAIFHFRRGKNKLDNRLICSLAKQLGKSIDPELRNAILSSVRKNPDIADQRLDEQFKVLFVTPLSAVGAKSFPVLIVVDALDECDSAEYAVDFIKLIRLKLPLLPSNVKFLLTTRPAAAIVRVLEPMEWNVESLDSATGVDADIERFLHHGFSEIRRERRIKEDWPDPSIIMELVQMSQGLFQWARTLIKYISEGSSTTRLSEILKAPKTWSGMDELYTQILSKAFEKVDPNPSKRDLLLRLLGTLLTAPHPVSLETVAFLHSDDDSMVGDTADEVYSFLRQEMLSDLSSLLFIPELLTEPIILMHTSIRDLLVDHRRSGEQSYWVDLVRNHQRLAIVCIRVMNTDLRQNICGLSNLSDSSADVKDLVERKLSKGTRYCCHSWSIHLTEGRRWSQSGPDDPSSQNSDFMLFTEKNILYWLEVMSLVGSVSEAIIMAKQVSRWLVEHCTEMPGYNLLTSLWNDVQRFVVAFAEPISFSPLHIYASALAHCPVKTEFWKLYGRHAEVQTTLGLQPPTWPLNLWTRSTDDDVWSLAFSPDGSLLAFGCRDGTVCLLDPQTGGQVGEPLIGCSGTVYSLCFSPDGSLLASGSVGRTTPLWDPKTGRQVGELPTGHSGAIYSLSFSPDGKFLACGSFDGTIGLWDPHTGRQVGEPLTGHTGTVLSVSFSPDGNFLASGSVDSTIILWAYQTGEQLIEPLVGHSDAVYSVCFSPDGSLLASGSGDHTIRLWDLHIGEQLIEPLEGHFGTIWSVCFSPDGRLLASGSFDKTIRLWDPQTGRQIREPLIDHSEPVRSVCFSPDTKLLASGSFDKTVQLCDPQAERSPGAPLTGLSGYVESLCFSPDGQLLASGSLDCKIRLWDSQTGGQVGEPLTGHTGGVYSISFSPNSQILASGSIDNTIRLWDLRTSRQVGEPLSGHSGSVYSVSFSPSGDLLASGSGDRTIRLWDLYTGKELIKPLGGHSGSIYCTCFSRDGKLLVSGCKDGTIYLWDPRSGMQVAEPLRGYSDEVRSISFSPDGRLIIWHDTSGHSFIWDTFTHESCNTLSSVPSRTPLFYEDHWVSFCSSRLFWLPSQYWGDRGCIIVLSDGKLAVAHDESLSIFDVSGILRIL